MAKFLFTAWPFAGHIHPCIAIAHALRSRGHEVAFYTGDSVRPEIEGEGFRCFIFEKVDEKRIKAIASSEVPYCESFVEQVRNARLIGSKLKEWFLDSVPDQLEDIEALIAEWRPDVVVCDLAFWGPFLILRETHGIPVAVLSVLAACILPGPDAPVWGNGKPRPRTSITRWRARFEGTLIALVARGFRAQADAMRARYGLPGLPCSVTEYAARSAAYLVPSTPEYDYQRTDLPASVHYVGPCLWDKPKQAPVPEWLATLPGDRPLIYVTEATVGTREPFLLRAAVRAFGNAPFDVVMTTGKQRDASEEDPGQSAPNVRVEPYIPQSDLLPRVSVMVTLGGSGGVLAALQAGVPLVVVPTEWDRPENAQRVVEAGAGIRLAPKLCTPERLRAAVEEVLADPLYSFHARRLAHAFSQRDGPTEAARVLEQLSPPLEKKELLHRQQSALDAAFTETPTSTW